MTTIEQIRWIPVEIEKPEEDVKVLVHDRSSGVVFAKRAGAGYWDNGHNLDGVTHWAAMPTGAHP